ARGRGRAGVRRLRDRTETGRRLLRGAPAGRCRRTSLRAGAAGPAAARRRLLARGAPDRGAAGGDAARGGLPGNRQQGADAVRRTGGSEAGRERRGDPRRRGRTTLGGFGGTALVARARCSFRGTLLKRRRDAAGAPRGAACTACTAHARPRRGSPRAVAARTSSPSCAGVGPGRG